MKPAVLVIAAVLSACVHGPHARYITAPPDTTRYKLHIPAPSREYADPIQSADR